MKLFGRRLTWWDYFPLFWLIFLIFPISSFFEKPRSPQDWVLFWLILLAFMGVYLRAFMVERDEERWAVVGWVAALAAYVLTYNVSGGQSVTFLIYGGALIGHQRSMALAMWLAVANCFIMIWPVLVGSESWSSYAWALPLMFFTVVGAYSNHLSFRAQVMSKNLEKVQLEKEKLAADAERERIARDLHDLLGHTLSVIVLKSELAAKLAEKNPQRAAQEIREVERISREALREVRAAVQGYRGSGLGAELARAKVALDAAGVKLTIMDTIPEVPEVTEASAAMLLREAVTNVVRHAHAREVKITMQPTAGGHTLTIQDDGIGGSSPEGTGLNSMRERLRAIGGTLEREGTHGTRLVAFFPAEGERQKAEGLEVSRV